MNIKIKGVDKVSKRIDKIKKNAGKVPKEQSVKLELLLNDSFLRSNSRFSSLQGLRDEFKKVFMKETSEELLSSTEGAKFISLHTNFATWEDLVNEAGKEYMKKQYSDAINDIKDV
jgi:hypothetical protein